MKALLVFSIFSAVFFSENALSFTGEPNANVEKCTITSFATIYRLSPAQYFNPKEVIQNSTCNEFINNKFSSLLSSTEGIALSSHLVNELANEFQNLTIEVLPNKISLQNLNDKLKNTLSENSNLYFTDTRQVNNKKLFALKENEKLEVFCDNCMSYGERNIRIDTVNILEGTRITHWVSSKLAANVSVLKAKHNIPLQKNKFEKEDFITEKLLTTEPNRFISNYEDVKFYKPSKTLIRGMPITTQDISPIQLVRYGTPVKLILKNQNINIQRSAIPHRSGAFGEIIELKNPQNNKLITGKVIDFNKVLIEL